MSAWTRHPVIYEINTWVWLGELSCKYSRNITLSSVPPEEWDAIARLGFDAVWLMGVWERSPAGIAIANRNAGLLEEFGRALADFKPEDNVGSPYCVRRYAVDEHLGGRSGLSVARSELAKRRLRLLLDFVPNHVAPDHAWVVEQPDFFVRGCAAEAWNRPESFVQVGGNVFACGRDPFYPAWPDVLQLNAFHPGLRQAVADTLCEIAEQCDGVRCDMAMLVLNDVFARTWSKRIGAAPAEEYWQQAISAVKKMHPDFLFMAEAYWDREWELQQQGFDFCYDKRLYDRLEHGPAESVRLHLCAELGYQRKLVRFIENHDEPRAAAVFLAQKARAAAVVMATIPGAKLIHEGQCEGRRVKLPVFLGRRPCESGDTGLRAFYRTLLKAVSEEGLCEGEWRLCDRNGWPDNLTCQNLVAWCWRKEKCYHLIVVNYSGMASQGLVRMPWDEITSATWQMTDLLSGREFERSGYEMCHPGLYVDLPPWGFHVLSRWQRVSG